MPLRWCWEPSEEEAFEVAQEHVRWAQREDLSPHEVLAAIGQPPDPNAFITWLQVTVQLARCWCDAQAVEIGDNSPRDASC